MLVSTIITQGINLADVQNTSFYTPQEALFAVQLAWEQIYAFLATNNDDYFLTQLYLPRSVTITGDITVGSNLITNISSTDIYTGVYISGTGIPANTGILTKNGTTLTLTENATENATTGTFTLHYIMNDANRIHVAGIDTTMDSTAVDTNTMFADGFYRLRLIQYQGAGGSVNYYPVQKMSIENYGNTQNTPAYRMVGNYIAIYDPTGYENFALWYYPRPVTLETTTDLAYPYNMIPEIMAYQLAAEIRRKQKADVTPWTTRVQELYGSMALQTSRDDSHGEPIKNQFGQGFAPYI